LRVSAFALFYLIAKHTAIAGQTPLLSTQQIQELVRESADKDLENTKRQRNYTYIQRNEQHHLDAKGRVTSTESKTYEIMVLSGEPTQKLIAKNDKPLSEKEARAEEDKIKSLVDKYRREDESARRKRLQKSEKEAEDNRRFVLEVADAFQFRFSGIETIAGRPAYVIDADPIPGYKPKSKDTQWLPDFRFKAWVDVADRQLVKADIECINTVSWGLFLARIHKGSKIHLEQVRINDEVWLPKYVSVSLDARVVLLKNLDMNIDITFRDYKKFVAETEIVPLGTVGPPPPSR
jgi:hypothetical protein